LINHRSFKSVELINRAVKVLHALSQDKTRVTDIADHLGLSVASVYRILQALKENGLVVQNELNHEYYLGQFLLTLTSNPFVAHQYLMNSARPKMEYLRSQTGETVSLYVAIGLERVRLLRLMGMQSITYVGKPNTLNPIWIGSTGKALLAQLPSVQLEIVLENLELSALTPHTITDKTTFQKEIQRVRERGYGTSLNEETLGVTSVSVPVPGYSQPVALSIVGPSDRFTSRMPEILTELQHKAAEISADLAKINYLLKSS
jgi:IclR family KDG regulon transcriptional repressor